MRAIDADKVLEKMRDVLDMQQLWLPIHFKELVIDDMPTLDVEMSVSAVWLTREYLQGGFIDRQNCCSNCGYETGHVISSWKYCPCCGAKIEKRGVE
jgi:hypothetical protein